MRIGIFTDTYYPEVNGVANSAYLLKKELEENGNQVYVFTVSNPEMNEPENHVYRMKSVPCPLLNERRMSCASLKKWYRVIAELNLDVIHTQTEFIVGYLGRRAAKKFGIPLLHTYHTIYEDYTHYLKIPGNDRMKGLVRSLSRICCDKADQVIVPTEKVEKMLIKYGVRKPIAIQPTGTPIQKFKLVDYEMVAEIKKKYRLKQENRILMSIGRLSNEKNIGELIDFMKSLVLTDTKVKLLVVGNGPERNNLENKAKELKLTEHIIFTGEVSWKQIQNYYAIGDVFVCASKSETQGLTYIEAMASGKPILVRKDECLDGVLRQGENGYGYQNKKEFLDFYNQIFKSENYQFMVGKAMITATQLSAEVFGKNIEHIYKKIVASKCQESEKEYAVYEKNDAVA